MSSLAILSTTDWEFKDLTSVTAAFLALRSGSGRITVTNAVDSIALDFLAVGVTPGGLAPIPKETTTLEKIIRGNLSSFIKLAVSPSSASPRLGSILKNTLNVSGDLQLHHLTDGIMWIAQGEMGAVLPGIQASLVFFGMPFSILLNTVSIVPFALLIPPVIISLL
jgi:hypothetical protein